MNKSVYPLLSTGCWRHWLQADKVFFWSPRTVHTHIYTHTHICYFTQLKTHTNKLVQVTIKVCGSSNYLWLCCFHPELLLMPPHLDQAGSHKLFEDESFKKFHWLCERRAGIDSTRCPGKHGKLKSHSPSKWEKLSGQRMAGVYRHTAPKYKSFWAVSRRCLLSVIWGSRSVQRASHLH